MSFFLAVTWEKTLNLHVEKQVAIIRVRENFQWKLFERRSSPRTKFCFCFVLLFVLRMFHFNYLKSFSLPETPKYSELGALPWIDKARQTHRQSKQMSLQRNSWEIQLRWDGYNRWINSIYCTRTRNIGLLWIARAIETILRRHE